MTQLPEPTRGGFHRPFGLGIFIRDFLAGKGPKYEVGIIDPRRGAPMADIFFAYKHALKIKIVRELVDLDVDKAIRKGKPLTDDQEDERREYHFKRTSMRQRSMRYASFTRYFHFFIQLGWVERTGEREASQVRDHLLEVIGEKRRTQHYEATTPWGTRLVEVPQPRIFYKLTETGIQAARDELKDPLQAVYNYPKEMRSPPPLRK